MKLNIISDFFRDIGNFLKGGTVLGIDIGTSSIKIIELTKRGDTFVVSNYGILETKKYLNFPNQAIQTSSVHISEKYGAELLSILLREIKPKTSLVVASIPAFTSFTTVLDIPVLSKEEVVNIVMFQAQQYIPLPLKKVSVEWHYIEEFEGPRGQRFQRILLTGIPNDVIERYKAIYKKAGLRLASLEIEQFALLRSLRNFISELPTLVVDIGAQSTDIAVVENGLIKQIEQTDYSGIYLTQALAKSLDISMVRAEELKRRRGLSPDGAESELSTLLLPFLDVIIQETMHAKTAYERRYGHKVERIMLVGGGANLTGIEKYFSSQTGMRIIHHSVFMGMSYSSEMEPVVKTLGNQLAVALGLAKKYFL
ncbi:MAG: type IV pilus assembly protein PilM [Candidatus Jorgensenbacteria bacterium GW2011_GWA2_45_9]|uniref:Type IV pilus assembly protein PilM n=1 Tax=Candidatus Jorgensenbacteria bacterium GW2011_GWA2_45_9 TaxID=1618663 RepID=A0A0G1N3L5_9BACT|nr:MAG: type IV pilus assembly protein PilM [Candidatus Jorgensenbacteria bacterium GW2011_GWA2_45_9]